MPSVLVAKTHKAGQAVKDRILYGPRPPVGRPFTPKARWRCALGLHRKSDTWAFTRIGEIEDVEEDRRGCD